MGLPAALLMSRCQSFSWICQRHLSNVWFVPNRNVRLTRSGWGGDGTGVLTMTQRERDRLVVLKKAEKKLITQSGKRLNNWR
jgi:hypothetical protein